MGLPLPKFSNWKKISSFISTKRITTNKPSAVGQFFKSISTVVGFLFDGIIQPFLQWSATKIWTILVSSVIFLFNFNWNISDEDLEARLKNAEIAWWAQLGSTIGTSLGWITCGFIPTAVVFSFNRALAAHILLNVGEEAYDEMISEVAALVNMSARNFANQWITKLFIAFRWMVKNVALNVSNDSLLSDTVGRLLEATKLSEAAKKWGDKGSKPWILSQKIEEAIENSGLELKYQAFLEEILESFGDSCIEAGYVVAGSIDEWIANQNLVNQSEQGQPNTVVVTPNRKAPEEKIILHGTTEQLRPAITQTIAHYQLIYNRDIGYDLGQPLIERAHKQISEYVIKLFLRSKIVPPDRKDVQKAEITINSANVLKFTDYDKVIRALGGGSDAGNIGYDYGNFVCIAQMSDGSILKLYANNRDNVLIRIEALAELTTAEIQTMNVTEEIKDYQRTKIDGLAKNIIRIYPRKMEIVRKTKVYSDYERSYTSTGNTKSTKQGYYNETPYSLSLWQGHKPANWDEIMQILTAPIAPSP